MAIFFLLVGLEIKADLLTGELNSPRKAAVPAIAAIGGMIAPAAIFFLIAHGGAAAREVDSVGSTPSVQ
jgi:Na+:H+ antiporter, NhaA family